MCQKWSTWYRKIKTSDLLAEIPICFRAPFCENLLLLTTGSFWLWLVLAVASGSHSKSFVKQYHSLPITPIILAYRHYILYCMKKNSAGFLQQSWRSEDHQNHLLSWKLTFFIIVQTVLSWRCSTPKSLAFVLPLLLHNTGLSGLYTEATKCDDMGYKPFTPSLVISVASMILLRLNSLDLHWPRI